MKPMCAWASRIAKGLKDELQLTWNDSILSLTPSAVNSAAFKEGFISPVIINETVVSSPISFSCRISLNGSEQLLFTPVGKQTTVTIQSTWPDPSFTGNQLPDSSSISEKGFQARWKSLSHTRNFPQAWKEDTYNLSSASFRS
jgi:inner membrane protein